MDRVLQSSKREEDASGSSPPCFPRQSLNSLTLLTGTGCRGDSPLERRRAKESAVPAVLGTRFLPRRENYNFQRLEEMRHPGLSESSLNLTHG